MNGMINWMARNGVAANLLMVFMLVAGFTSAFQLTIKLFPDIDLDLISIRVVYPGASPTEVEESIIRRIEEKIESVEDIQDIMTYNIMSTPGVVVNGQVVHSGGVPTRDAVESWF